jgi:hypothetical protein
MKHSNRTPVRKLVKAWKSLAVDGRSRRDVRLTELMAATKMSANELYRLNISLGGEYGYGWEYNESGVPVCTAGDKLWALVREGK